MARTMKTWLAASTAGRIAIASRTAVFETNELLENFLLFLPRTDIMINAQSVSSTWKNLITKSPQIQAILWGPRTPSGHTHEIAATRDDAAATSFLDSSDDFMPQETKLATGMSVYLEPIALKSLFLKDPERQHIFMLSQNPIEGIGLRKTVNMLWAIDIPIGSPGQRPSWFDQYMTSPPIKAAQICAYSMAASRWTLATVYDPHGITYGIAAEALHKIRASFKLTRHSPRRPPTPMISFIVQDASL